MFTKIQQKFKNNKKVEQKLEHEHSGRTNAVPSWNHYCSHFRFIFDDQLFPFGLETGKNCYPLCSRLYKCNKSRGHLHLKGSFLMNFVTLLIESLLPYFQQNFKTSSDWSNSPFFSDFTVF